MTPGITCMYQNAFLCSDLGQTQDFRHTRQTLYTNGVTCPGPLFEKFTIKPTALGEEGEEGSLRTNNSDQVIVIQAITTPLLKAEEIK